MAFNIALSGLKAASNDLKITGNNIANASTTGFKESRAEFADVYAASILGSGASHIGSGVRLADVSQQFEQGTIAFTSNSLDIAIDGEGFFVLDDGGERSYTRAGLFGLDSQGFMVTNSGARLQGFNANAGGTVSGILGDVRIETGNLAPKQTTQVQSKVNVDAQEQVKAEFGTKISTLSQIVGAVQGGVALDTPTTLTSSVVTAAGEKNFSINTRTSVTAIDSFSSNPNLKDFSVDLPSRITAPGIVQGHNFSVNSPSTLSSTAVPTFFNFSGKSTAVTGTQATTPADFSVNNASFDVTIANGSGANGNATVTVTLDKNISNITDLLADINDDLAGVDVVAFESPAGSNAIEFRASVAGEASTVTVGNYAGAGAANVQAALSDIAAASTSAGSTFDITVGGGTVNGTATINLTANITSFQGLIVDIQDQLSASGIDADVRADPNNAGHLQFFSKNDGVASSIVVGNYQSGTSQTQASDIKNLLGVVDGATNNNPGVGATGVTGSLTAATFDVNIDLGGTNPDAGSVNRSATINLTKNYNDDDISSLVADINSQLAAVASPGINVRAQEDPQNAGRLQFYSTISGDTSKIRLDSFSTSGVNGSEKTNATDIGFLLGGLTEGSVSEDGNNTSAKFQVSLEGSSVAAENRIATVTLDKNIQTLSDLIADIRDDLQASGVGIDVREDPTKPGQGLLQFYATRTGEASEIKVNSQGVNTLELGNGTDQGKLKAILGGIPVNGTATSATVDDPAFSSEVGSLSSAKFDVTLAGASTGNGTVTITLDKNITNVSDLIADIQDDLRRAASIGVDVREDPDNAGQLQFFSTISGEESTIVVNNFDDSNSGVSVGEINGNTGIFNVTNSTSTAGIAKVDNGYGSQTIDVVNSSGATPVTTQVTTLAGETAAEIAARFSAVSGVNANAETNARITNFTNDSGSMQTIVNGQRFTATSLPALAEQINSDKTLQGITATFDEVEISLTVTSSTGRDIDISIAPGTAADTVTVAGPAGSLAANSNQVLSQGGNLAATVGGTVNFIFNEKVTLANDATNGTGLFGAIEPQNFEAFTLNAFDPKNQETYNSATSVTVYDSQGNAHVMTQFFVKEAVREDDPLSKPNEWTMYVQIDGEDVGDPDAQNPISTQAGYKLQFDESGRFLPEDSDTVLVSNWTPNTSGALGPLNLADGGSAALLNDPLAEPSSSNFLIDMADSTQFGSVFSVDAVDQNGFTTGRLSGLDVADDGIIFARYTNGENQTLGQVTLANFSNVQGLKNLGGTTWAQTFESGEPTVGTPRSSSLGALNSGALEDSNVELSDQLVQLIIAQRNFQANAKTIQTADAITQTIINLR